MSGHMAERGFEVWTREGAAPVKAWVRGVPVEPAAREQVEKIAGLPFIYRHVAVMPDVHVGKGATVGSVIATRGAIIPAAVGVDIGCGMVAARTTLRASDLPDSLAALRSSIEAAVPHGRTNDGRAGDRGSWGDLPRSVWGLTHASGITTGRAPTLHLGFLRICEKHPKLESGNLWNHLGTLGTGNHFVEVCLDEEQRVWIMLHSGSRGVGARVGGYFIERAKEEARRWFVNLPDKELGYLPEGTPLFDDYVEAVTWAQDFARANRQLMLDAVLAVLRDHVRPFELDGVAVNCHHNYIARENHFGANVFVTRKGAVRAREGDLGIIPGSMGARSFIVRGKGNRDSFHSCSHGAGRVMSRGVAHRTITLEQHALATAGIECRKDAGVIDESPAAYKSIDAVMAAQRDLVDVVHELRQVLCVKG